MLEEYKSDWYHYFEDDEGRYQGECKRWDENGQLYIHCFWVNGKLHGERKRCFSNGTLMYHDFYVDDEVYRDLLEEPVTDEEKFMITLETGGEWLC
jgi:antitoxin component YwqK of YwqJK toxin-antitoxin module